MLDMRDDFGVPDKPEYVLIDGGHLTIEGQKIIVEAFVNKLSKL